MGLHVDEVRIAGHTLRLERDPFLLVAPEPGKLEVFVSDASLAKFLEHMSPAGLKKFQVSAKEGKLYIQAVKTVILDLKASAVCTLRIEDKRRLFVAIETVEVAGAGIKNLLEAQLAKINPIIDVAMFPFQATLDTVSLATGGITLHGRISP